MSKQKQSCQKAICNLKLGESTLQKCPNGELFFLGGECQAAPEKTTARVKRAKPFGMLALATLVLEQIVKCDSSLPQAKLQRVQAA